MTARASPPASSLWHPDLLANALFNQRLTVLVGSRGPQREGMLRSGLMPRLRRHRPRDRDAVAIRFDGWGVLPLRALRDRIDAVFGTTWPDGPPPSLAAHLRAIGRLHGTTVLLVLDAFERHLAERAQRPDIEEFDRELAACITDPTVPLHALMVVDERRATIARAVLRLDRGRRCRLPAAAERAARCGCPLARHRHRLVDRPARRSGPHDAEWTLDLVLDETPAAPDVMPPPAAHAAWPRPRSRHRTRRPAWQQRPGSRRLLSGALRRAPGADGRASRQRPHARSHAAHAAAAAVAHRSGRRRVAPDTSAADTLACTRWLGGADGPAARRRVDGGTLDSRHPAHRTAPRHRCGSDAPTGSERSAFRRACPGTEHDTHDRTRRGTHHLRRRTPSPTRCQPTVTRRHRCSRSCSRRWRHRRGFNSRPWRRARRPRWRCGVPMR